MASPNHIALLCSRLDMPGGIERAVVNTANLFASKGHTVTLMILDETSESFYAIDPVIHIIRQPLSFGITKEGNIFSRKLKMLSDVLKLKRILSSLQADVIISSEYPFTVAMVLAGSKKEARIFSWEHHHYAWLEKNKFWTRLFKYACRRVDGIICLNQEEKRHYDQFAPVTVIPNHVENTTGKVLNPGSRQLLTIGRLIPRKGIDLLLQAAKPVLAKHPDWTWKIIGDGEMRNDVLDFITKEKLEGRLIVEQPKSNDLSESYSSASLYVMTSRFEAFPMVLLEAMSFGIPCVSFDCPSGPSEIISHDKTGLLVPKENTGALVTAIDTLILDPGKRKNMSSQTLINVQQYYPDRVYRQWEKLLFD